MIGTIAMVLASITAGLFLDRRFGILPRRERLQAAAKRTLPAITYAEGEAPATALYASIGEIERLRRRLCSKCKAVMNVGADDEILYEGRTLHVLSFACPRCNSHDRLYIERAPDRDN